MKTTCNIQKRLADFRPSKRLANKLGESYNLIFSAGKNIGQVYTTDGENLTELPLDNVTTLYWDGNLWSVKGSTVYKNKEKYREYNSKIENIGSFSHWGGGGHGYKSSYYQEKLICFGDSIEILNSYMGERKLPQNYIGPLNNPCAIRCVKDGWFIALDKKNGLGGQETKFKNNNFKKGPWVSSLELMDDYIYLGNQKGKIYRTKELSEPDNSNLEEIYDAEFNLKTIHGISSKWNINRYYKSNARIVEGEKVKEGIILTMKEYSRRSGGKLFLGGIGKKGIDILTLTSTGRITNKRTILEDKVSDVVSIKTVLLGNPKRTVEELFKVK